MSLPTAAVILAALAATWPAAGTRRLGPWTLREGRGGGKRVSAATAEGPVAAEDLAQLEAAAAAEGAPPLVMVRDGEDTLDAHLAERGYRVVDPTLLYAGSVAPLAAAPLPPVSAFSVWPPLAIVREIWEAGGIGPARQAVMDRAAPPKTAILGRTNDRAAGAAFVAVHGALAMIHAIEVSRQHRRQATARNMMRCAARWAQDHEATYLTLAVTRANAPANALYASLGLSVVGHYHYRIKKAETATRSRP